MKCPSNKSYNKYVPKFNDFAKKKLNLQMETFQDQQEFGKACSYFVNQKKCKHHLNKHEHFRHIVFLFLKILWIVLLFIYLLLYFIPFHVFDSDVIKKIDDQIENVLIVFSSIVLIYFFIPIYPRPILSRTDILITFSAGILLMLIGIKNIFLEN
jgi:hypothetical protein